MSSFNCALCGETLEDALILTCGHNLCLDCASREVKNSYPDWNGQNPIVYSCSLCTAITTVDGDTVRYLKTMNPVPKANNPVIQPVNGATGPTPQPAAQNNAMDLSPTPVATMNNANMNNFGGSANIGMNGSKGQQMVVEASNSKTGGPIATNNVQSVTSMCPAHPDEPLAYFCLDCECKCICAECVIHGLHKGHEVLSVKKAYPLLQSKVSSLSVELRERWTELNTVAQSWERKQREMLNTQDQMKAKLQEHFAEIRKTLQVKEHDMMKLMGEGLRDGLNFAENKMHEIRDQIHQLKEAQVQMHHNTSHPATNMQSAIDALNWYADARLSLNQLLVAELPFPTEESKPNEWLQKYGETTMGKVRDLHLIVQQLT